MFAAMKLLRCLAFSVGLLPVIASVAQAAFGGAPQHVKATLVAAEQSIQPGRAFTVALRLEHDAHWHTYWINPGTGYPTSLEWTLPEGFEAGEIQWPAPVLLKDSKGTVMGNGYENVTYLPVTITPPANLAAGGTVELKAAASWLMCADVCIPGDQDVSLTLPVRSEEPQRNAEFGGEIAATLAELPRELKEWTVSARQDGKTMVVTVKPAGGAAVHAPGELHVFAEDNLVAYELPQDVVANPDGGYTIRAPISPDGPQDATHLKGVITASNGWLPGGKMRGLSVNAALGAEAKTSASASAGTNAGSGASGTAASGATGGAGLGGTLLLAFVGGLILNLMPCVFPVLGIKILGFVNQAGHERGKIVAHGLVFTLGVLLSFWALAAVLAILRAGGAELGWGFQLQSPAFVYALAVLLLVFALNMSGVFEFGLRATAIGGELQTKSGYSGSFFTGVLATVVATPCSAPFLAPALGAALALSTVESFAIFTAIALGLSTPYLLLSAFPQAVNVLPRPGAWMETFKQFMAFPLYATVGYMIWVLAGQVNEEGLQYLLLGLVLVAMAVWFYGRWTAPGASSGRRNFGIAALVIVGAAGLWLGWPKASATVQSSGATVVSGGVTWEPWSPEAVERLRAEGRVVYVDFTARWCFTCQTNKKVVFGSDEVLKEFADRKVATLRADWTNKDPRITAELAKYQRSAVPFNVVWKPGAAEPVILPELLTPRIVLEAVREG